MSEEDRLELEQECLLKYSKAQMIEKYIDELAENEIITEQWYKSQQENKQLKEDKKKAIEYIKRTIKIIKEQPSSCELNDIWTLEHLNSFLEILGDKE